MPFFRALGLVEGLSFLVLLLIAMPLKYAAGMPEAVRVVGMAHGLLFIAYVFVALWMGGDRSWPKKRLALAFVAAVVPLGTFVFDRAYLKEDLKDPATSRRSA